ncbi:hypothetical protein [Streptomyces angustmyceticus]|uniref:hypothetical protein n=1 Tax=Streptomyces angustmyceticus TaxID=285578 RepID=UPI003D89BDFA
MDRLLGARSSPCTAGPLRGLRRSRPAGVQPKGLSRRVDGLLVEFTDIDYVELDV